MRSLTPAQGFAVAFIDPPYGAGLGVMAAAALDDLDLIAASGLVVVEDVAGSDLADRINGLVLRDARKYGDTGFWLYSRETRDTKS